MLQLLTGVLSIYLVYLIGREIHSEKVGICASFLLAFSGIVLFYEMVLLRTSLIIFANCLLCYLLLKIINSKELSNKNMLGFGVLSGLSYILKPTLIIYSIAGLLVCLFRYKKKLAPLLLGITLSLLPLVYRNYIVSAPLFSVSSVGPITFIASNTPDYSAERGFSPSKKFVPIALGNTSGSMSSSIVASLSLFGSPIEYLKLVLSKAEASLRWFEEPNNVNFYFYKLHTPILGFLPVGFPILFCLGLVGFIFSLKNIKKVWPIYIYLLPIVAVLLALYPISRFRVVAYPPLAILSAIALFELLDYFIKRRYLTIAFSAVFIISASVYIYRPLPQGKVLIRSVDYVNPHRYYYKRLIQVAKNENDLELVADLYQESLRISPKFILEKTPPSNWSEKSITAFYAEIYPDYAIVLEQIDSKEKANEISAFAEKLNRWSKINQATPPN